MLLAAAGFDVDIAHAPGTPCGPASYVDGLGFLAGRGALAGDAALAALAG